METCLFFNDCDPSLGNHLLDEKAPFYSFDSSSVEQEAQRLFLREKGCQDDDFFNFNFLDTFNDPELLSRNLPNILEDPLPDAVNNNLSLSECRPNLEEPCPSLPETLITHTSLGEQAPSCVPKVPQLLQMKELIGNLDESFKTSLRNSLYQLAICASQGEAKPQLEKTVENNLMRLLFGTSCTVDFQQVQPSVSRVSVPIPQVSLPLDFSKIKNLSMSHVPSPLDVVLPASPLSISADSSPRALLCLSPSLVRPLSSPESSPLKQTSQKRSLSLNEGDFTKTKRPRAALKGSRKLKTSSSLSLSSEILARNPLEQHLLKGNSATAQ